MKWVMKGHFILHPKWQNYIYLWEWALSGKLHFFKDLFIHDRHRERGRQRHRQR